MGWRREISGHRKDTSGTSVRLRQPRAWKTSAQSLGSSARRVSASLIHLSPLSLATCCPCPEARLPIGAQPSPRSGVRGVAVTGSQGSSAVDR